MMRHFIFVLILLLMTTAAQAQNATITIDIDGAVTTITLSNTDQLAMKNDLLSISDWIENAIQGKVRKTRERIIRQGITILRTTGQKLPTDDNILINRIVSQPGYKNRVEREKESTAAIKAMSQN